jgi:hypothetical protein
MCRTRRISLDFAEVACAQIAVLTIDGVFVTLYSIAKPMRDVIAVVFLIAGAAAGIAAAPPQSGRGQGERPRISPHETTTGVVDGNHMTVVYGRPSMRGRKIWGGLVRWGTTWTPGADEATLLTTERPLLIEGQRVPGGTYSLYMVVDPQHPQLIVNTQTGQWHTIYTRSKDLLRVDVQREALPVPVEQLTIAILPRPEGGGTLAISWDTTRYAVRFAVVPNG